MFSDKTKTADAKWKIRTFKQGKQNTANFIIEFKALAMKVDIDELYAIFLLKKSVQQDIINTILEYPSIVALKLLENGRQQLSQLDKDINLQKEDRTPRQKQE